MTTIEIKELFEKQRNMGLKTKQMKKRLGSISSQVFWEKNQYVTHNPKIDSSQIIAKTSTDKFPVGATTIRFHSLKNKLVTAYFYGKPQTRYFPNGQGYTCQDKLTVTFPNTDPMRHREWGYCYQGTLCKTMTRQELNATVDYIEDVLSDFLNL